jgi:predicted RNA-binding Zn ribbon-like protein
MTFSWTSHRFSGGALALDVANSVVLRHDEARRVDRFAVDQQLAPSARYSATYSPRHRKTGQSSFRYAKRRTAISAAAS